MHKLRAPLIQSCYKAEFPLAVTFFCLLETLPTPGDTNFTVCVADWSDSSEQMLYIWKSKADGDHVRAVRPLSLCYTVYLIHVLAKCLHPKHSGLGVLVLTMCQTCWTWFTAFASVHLYSCSAPGFPSGSMENLYWAVPQMDKIPVFIKMSLFILLVMYNNIVINLDLEEIRRSETGYKVLLIADIAAPSCKCI